MQDNRVLVRLQELATVPPIVRSGTISPNLSLTRC